jgi:hypothetical protein
MAKAWSMVCLVIGLSLLIYSEPGILHLHGRYRSDNFNAHIWAVVSGVAFLLLSWWFSRQSQKSNTR